jgi:predicted secreted protein
MAALALTVMAHASVTLAMTTLAMTVKLGADDGPNVSLLLHAGDRIHLELPEQAGAAYVWQQIPGDTPNLEMLGSTNRADGGVFSTRGTRSFTWRAISPGDASLSFGYGRPYDHQTAPLKTYAIQAIILPSALQEGALQPAAPQPADDEQAKSSAMAVREFEGRLPCADCSAIRELLTLRQTSADGAGEYIMKLTYLDAPGGNRTFAETGLWKTVHGTKADANATIIELDHGGKGAPEDLQMKGDQLIPLDAQQIPITGPTGFDLTLHRIVAKPQ